MTDAEKDTKAQMKSDGHAHPYAALCAAIGERHFLIAQLSAEIAALTKKLMELKSPESSG